MLLHDVGVETGPAVVRFRAAVAGIAAGAVLAVMLAVFLLGFVMDAFEIVFVVVPIVAPALLQMPVSQLPLQTASIVAKLLSSRLPFPHQETMKPVIPARDASAIWRSMTFTSFELYLVAGKSDIVQVHQLDFVYQG